MRKKNIHLSDMKWDFFSGTEKTFLNGVIPPSVQYRGRRNIKCEPPKTVAPPLTDQTTPINNLCWVLNHS